ncbi:hypothetical protein PYCCODRAFT_1431568 [Trametes coccinea BRFM310]|uniref:Uncharacterized protein n=1 Tax=Trametes coccinea (strain BRFM310) TaxID=1353009 RepID=A0A1Y2J0X8_TRAC3|nr:hypothetical protein PYCCODRAFT_1431568 [Trametes coccinea BRFM310]
MNGQYEATRRRLPAHLAAFIHLLPPLRHPLFRLCFLLCDLPLVCLHVLIALNCSLEVLLSPRPLWSDRRSLARCWQAVPILDKARLYRETATPVAA